MLAEQPAGVIHSAHQALCKHAGPRSDDDVLGELIQLGLCDLLVDAVIGNDLDPPIRQCHVNQDARSLRGEMHPVRHELGLRRLARGCRSDARRHQAVPYPIGDVAVAITTKAITCSNRMMPEAKSVSR